MKNMSFLNKLFYISKKKSLAFWLYFCERCKTP